MRHATGIGNQKLREMAQLGEPSRHLNGPQSSAILLSSFGRRLRCSNFTVSFTCMRGVTSDDLHHSHCWLLASRYIATKNRKNSGINLSSELLSVQRWLIDHTRIAGSPRTITCFHHTHAQTDAPSKILYMLPVAFRRRLKYFTWTKISCCLHGKQWAPPPPPA